MAAPIGRTAIAPRNKMHYPFLDLPAELRNRVYAYVFESTTIKAYLKEPVPHPDSNVDIVYIDPRPGAARRSLVRTVSGLSPTCRLINTESQIFLENPRTLKIDANLNWKGFLRVLREVAYSFDTVRELVISEQVAGEVIEYFDDYGHWTKRPKEYVGLVTLLFPGFETLRLPSSLRGFRGLKKIMRWCFCKPELRL